MTHSIKLQRQKKDYYSDGSGKWSYLGETLQINIEGEPDITMVEYVEERINTFKKLVAKNTDLYLQQSIQVDWATFKYFLKTYKKYPSHPNSCFYCTLDFANRRAQLHIYSPTINFDYNSFTK